MFIYLYLIYRLDYPLVVSLSSIIKFYNRFKAKMKQNSYAIAMLLFGGAHALP